MQTNSLQTHLHTLAILMANLKKAQGCDISEIDEFFDSIAELIFKLLDEEPSGENERAEID